MRYLHVAPREDEQRSGVRAKYVTTGSQPLVCEGEVIEMPRGNKLIREHLKKNRDRFARVFHALLVRRGVPIVELAEAMGIGAKEVAEMCSGKRAISGEHIFAMEERFGLALLDEVRIEFINNRRRGHE